MPTQITQTIRIRPKGQMTLPAELRDYLQLEENDVVTARKEEGRVILENPLRKLRQALAESAKYFADIPPLEPEEIRRLATESITQSVAEKLVRIEQDRLGTKATSECQQVRVGADLPPIERETHHQR